MNAFLSTSCFFDDLCPKVPCGLPPNALEERFEIMEDRRVNVWVSRSFLVRPSASHILLANARDLLYRPARHSWQHHSATTRDAIPPRAECTQPSYPLNGNIHMFLRSEWVATILSMPPPRASYDSTNKSGYEETGSLSV